MEKLAQAGEGGVHAQPHSHVQSCSVRTSWIGSYTDPISFLPLSTLWYFMYLRAIFCTFQISVDFYYVPVGGRGVGEGSWRRGAGEGEGARERGIECILYGYT